MYINMHKYSNITMKSVQWITVIIGLTGTGQYTLSK